jgi:hypothetical protein
MHFLAMHGHFPGSIDANSHLVALNAQYRDDNVIPVHLARPVQRYLHKHRTIVVELFPSRAPDLNPVDKIWFYVKFDCLPNYTPPNLSDLRLRVTEEFRRLQRRPDVLDSLFNLTKLTLDLNFVPSSDVEVEPWSART